MVHQAAAQEDYCHWEAYMGTFESVSQPHSLQIGYREKLLVPVEIQRPYLKKRVQVGACFSPLFYIEHWQLVVLTIETYRHFGVTLQIVYLMSAFEGIFEILKDYNATDVISIEPWYSVDLVGMNYNGNVKNPNMEIVWRNQAAAHTDCLMKYGYAAEFLIVGDFDDILVPDHGTYYDEFIRLAVPTAAALVYTRFHVHITTTKNASYFSLFDTLMSAKVNVHTHLTPKYVANTARAESLWIHSPYIVRSNCIFQNVPVMEGRMFHLRKWNFLEDNEAAGYNKSISEQSSDADAQNATLKFRKFDQEEVLTKRVGSRA
uniref:Glycosyltransferase family 92 protein n=1 Tax=Globodera pallida TaxID=36090 RepID=A0A183BRJ2_GLOPA